MFTAGTHHPKRQAFRSRSRIGDDGQSLLEVAVILPILALILAAIVDAGRAFDAYIVLTNAAREGARAGSLDNGLGVSDIQAIVIENVHGSGTNIAQITDLSTSNVTVEGLGSSVAVTVTIDYDLKLWFGGLIGLDVFHLGKQAVMPVF